jgi:hypothetical protein
MDFTTFMNFNISTGAKKTDMQSRLQHDFLEKIFSRFPKKAEAIDYLADLLSLGKDAIYRRARGETPLHPDELDLLANHFRESIDAIAFEHSNTVFMSFNGFTHRIGNFMDYLKDLHVKIDQTARFPDSHFYYASMEIPVFHYMYFPELISFKLYVWGMTTWGLDFLEGKAFDFDLVSYPELKKAEEILQLYNTLESTELWSLGIVDNTLNQIEYVSAVNNFTRPEDALLLCDKLLELTDHMQEMAAQGHKFSLKGGPEAAGAPFHLFHNEMVSTNNTLLVSTPVGQALYTTFENPNFLASTDSRLCRHTEQWLNRVIGKSNAISNQSERARIWFFNRLRRKINGARSRIENVLVE